MANLYLLQYNNYYNRIKKKEGDTPQDYVQFKVSTAGNYQNPVTNVNFIIKDGIRTEAIINWSGDMPDYIIVTEEVGNTALITSRWFVTRTEFTTAGQHRFYLLRDVVADYMASVESATAYIRRANLPDTNPLIYNSEGISFNQIKKSESLLYDKTGTAWIVGYIASNFTSEKNISVSMSNEPSPLTNYEELLTYSNNNQKVLTGTPTLIFTTLTNPGSPTWRTYTVTPGNNATVAANTDSSFRWAGIQQTSNTDLTQEVTNNFLTRGEQLKSALANYVTNLSIDNTYIPYNGRVVRSSDGRYFKVTVTNVSNKQYTENVRTGTASNSLYSTVQNMVTATDGINYRSGYDPFHQWCKILYTASEYKLTLTEITYGDLSVDIPTTKQALSDAPYFMFGMKYNDGNLKLAIEIAKELTSANVYDIQVLPYCPALEYYNDLGGLQTPVLTEDVEYSVITNADNHVVDYMVWCPRSTFTFDIPFEINVTDIKVSNECDKYRLCSPNGNGQFEFNAAKNNGVRNINVDCTYKPIDPYIHLNPDFSGLYGQDFNDFRGLILQGDFSIPMINDKWQEYQVQNKNYEAIFNRQIQNLDVIQSVQRRQDLAQMIVGTFQGGATGAGIGGMFGGGIGAGIGGVLGGAASLGGGLADYFLNEKLRNEQKSFQTDMYNMQLGNIQALPYSIAKTGCLTNNNKLVPYVEYYTCTDEEKAILSKLILEKGCTVGAMGIISDYIIYNNNNYAYIEGDLWNIDLQSNPDMIQDYSVTMEIAREINMGIRLKRQVEQEN